MSTPNEIPPIPPKEIQYAAEHNAKIATLHLTILARLAGTSYGYEYHRQLLGSINESPDEILSACIILNQRGLITFKPSHNSAGIERWEITENGKKYLALINIQKTTKLEIIATQLALKLFKSESLSENDLSILHHHGYLHLSDIAKAAIVRMFGEDALR